jgi:hypothetical protein
MFVEPTAEKSLAGGFMMKRTITLALVLALLALAACSPAQQTSPPPLHADEGIVFTTQERPRGHEIPVVNLDSPAAARINEEITWWAQQLSAAAELGWFYALHSNILSLVLCIYPAAAPMQFFTWLLDVSTGELASNAQLLVHAGWEHADLRDTLLAWLSGFYSGLRDDEGNLPAHAQQYYTRMQHELAHPEVPRLFLSQGGNLFWIAQLSYDDERVEALVNPATLTIHAHWEGALN